jgi:hypothetical protein
MNSYQTLALEFDAGVAILTLQRSGAGFYAVAAIGPSIIC